ncbi:MAG: DUF6882 domain-containing protein [Gemmatimonadaceae bacterium]
MPTEVNWAEWSREAVALMQARNRDWTERFDLAGAPYRWDLDRRTLTFARRADAVAAEVCVVGTASICAGTFLWAWANDAIAAAASRRLDAVREFGRRHALDLLTTAEWPGGRAEGLEMLAVAGRILEAEGGWVDTDGDLTLFFLLFGLHTTTARQQADT